MKGIVLLLFIFSCLSAYSQAVIEFNTTAHDFGNIKEVNGSVSYDFTFTNKGTAPILIKNVESSCGCTSPEWTKQPVLPGKTGYVRAIFDPKDRPSYFDKTITVYSNAKTPVIVLNIKGNVEGKTRTVLDDYPYEQPSGLRLPLDHISLMKATKGETKSMAIGVYNNAGRKVAVSFAGLPPYLKISMEPQQLEAKKTGTINASYNTALKGEFGANEEMVTMIVDGKKYQLPVSVFIEQNFSATDRVNAPVATVDKKYYNFGITTPSKPVLFVYKVTNTGKSAMKIHRVYANDKRVNVTTSKNELQPGETADITAKTLVGANTGKMTCLVSVITNCPDSPEVALRFYGEIK